jgi:hypothetical protein
MSKQSRRPGREEIKRLTKEKKQAAKQLRKRQVESGFVSPPSAAMSNRKSEYETVEEERAARQKAVEEQIKIFRSMLPTLLRRFSEIKDPRNPKKLKHKLAVVML